MSGSSTTPLPRIPLPTNRCHEIRTLFHLMWPILITQVAQAGFGLIDTVMAGRMSPSDLAVVAVGVGLWLPVVLFLAGVMIATTPLVAEAKGAGHSGKIPWITQQSLYLALLLGMAGFALLQLAPLTFNLLDIPAHLQPKARFFLHAIAFGMPAVTLFATLRSYTEALGYPRPVTVISILGLLGIIPLNHVFMHGLFGLPKLGGAGCGIATASIQWIMLLVLAIYISLAKTYQQVKIFQQFSRFNLAMNQRIFSLGAPIGMAIFFEVSLFSIAAIILSPLGEIVVSAHQIALSVTSVFFMAPLSLGMALTIRVGQLYGEQNWSAMQYVQRLGFIFATSMALFSMLLMLLFRQQITGFYTTDTTVQAAATSLLLFALMYQLSDAWQVAAAGCLRGIQDTQGPMWITLLSYWGIALPLGIVLSRVLPYGAAGVWTGLVIGLTIAAVLLSFRLRQRQKLLFQHLAAQVESATISIKTP
ncbi:MAG: MATE family efflux transporter [Moraxellaceae bacterium]|nr:MAG: MATE family efflux transporter [Moraxellaceae bacterium]